jgi:hypothetical protein
MDLTLKVVLQLSFPSEITTRSSPLTFGIQIKTHLI